MLFIGYNLVKTMNKILVFGLYDYILQHHPRYHESMECSSLIMSLETTKAYGDGFKSDHLNGTCYK